MLRNISFAFSIIIFVIIIYKNILKRGIFMFTSTKSEQITQLLNEWYIEIRLRRIDSANRFKEQIDNKINI